ncbi:MULTISPECIES: AAA family ATPase [Aeromicrobium]|uniref:AAA family ATPase n=1 Tax=Aeromicrobium TaxID=2040 RepID=UPI00257C0773|nr:MULTISPECIES: AAA family ATPase [Aeromicrobium]
MRRIVEVSGAGIFDRWSPSSDVEDFSRVNVIYGGNGSGKSSLARAFSSMADDDHSGPGVIVEAMSPDGAARRVTDRSDAFWSRVRVFDKDFVKKNLLFDVGGRSEALPLLVLGAPNVDRDRRLTQIAERLAEVELELSRAQDGYKRGQESARKLETDVARTITQELQTAGGRFTARSYNAVRVRDGLNDPTKVTSEASDDEIAADLQIVQSQRLEELELLPATQFSLAQLEVDVTAALEESIVSDALTELAGNTDAEQWVRKGIDLHEHRERCLMCNNVLNEDRRAELDRHFDESFTKLQDQLDALDRALMDEDERIGQVLRMIPDRALLYPDLRERYGAQREESTRQVAEYMKRIAALRELVARKRASPFTVVVPGDPFVGNGIVDFDALNAVIDEHNDRSADFQRVVSAAADRIERARLTAIAGEHSAAQGLVQDSNTQIEQLTLERRELGQERERINVQDLDASPLAEELTRDLATLFGREELSFGKEGKRYSIQRNGQPATDLSEGERTAISLLYFLCSLRDERTRGISATVLIDDPVSSLDHEILVGVSSHLWSALVGNASTHQVLLFTHSFELFRLWSNQLDRLPGPVKKACPYAIYELRTRFGPSASGEPVRRPAMVSWSDVALRKKLRSQYHYLFWRVGSLVIDDSVAGDLASELEATAIIPNAARRMLEAFLAFKCPSKIGDFEGSMRRTFEEGLVADPLRQRVTRFLHQQSHNEDADISRPVGIGEAVNILRSAFDFIAAVDRDHFSEMCVALDLDATRLSADAGASDLDSKSVAPVA